MKSFGVYNLTGYILLHLVMVTLNAHPYSERSSHDTTSEHSSIEFRNSETLSDDSSRLSRSISGELTTRNHHRPRHSHHRKRVGARNSTDIGYATVYISSSKVPIYECSEGQWACTYPNKEGYVPCISEERQCDDAEHCPKGADEDPALCDLVKKLMERINRQDNKILQMERIASKHTDEFYCELGNLESVIIGHRHRRHGISKPSVRPCDADDDT